VFAETGVGEMASNKLVERARLNHYRARQCRELMAMIGDLRALTILDDYAKDLESRASALEAQAQRSGEVPESSGALESGPGATDTPRKAG
jgi:hypothetical protein